MDSKKCWLCIKCRTWSDMKYDDERPSFCSECGAPMQSGYLNAYKNVPYDLDTPNQPANNAMCIIGILALMFGSMGILGGISQSDFAILSAALLVFVVGFVVLLLYYQKYQQNKNNAVLLSPVTYVPRVQASTAIPTAKADIPATLPAKSGDYVRKYQYKKVKIAGTEHLEDKTIISSSLYRKQVMFAPEPDNEYDDRALRVDCDGHKLGYMPRNGRLRDMIYDFDSRGDTTAARVDSVDAAAAEVTIIIGFYVDAEKMHSRECKLTGNRNEETQSNIASCSPDDEVNFSYDDEKEKYIVTATDDIGLLSVNDSRFIDRLGENKYVAVVSRTEVDDKDKYNIWIMIYYG